MLQKQSWVQLSDSSSVMWLRVFQLYGGFCRHTSGPGFFIKGSVKVLKPQHSFYKGFNSKKFKKGSVRRALIIRGAFVESYTGSLWLNFIKNSATLIKKKNILLSAHTLGPASRHVRNKRVLLLFKGCL